MLVEVNPGPVITRFEIQPAPGVKVYELTNLAKILHVFECVKCFVWLIIAGKITNRIEILIKFADTV